MCYDELHNEDNIEELSDSDLTSSDGEGDEDTRAAAILDGDGKTLAAEDDFASAVARAAQLAGLTVVGTTVTDSAKGRLHTLPTTTRSAVWLSGNALASINVVALRQTRLVPAWVTVCGQVNHLGM